MTTLQTGRLAIEGGVPVRDIQKRPWPNWPIYNQAEEQALNRVLHSGKWWYVDGEEGKLLEEEFAAFQEAKFGVACTNGTAALEICLRALEIGPGDEVIVPPYSFVATASAVLTVGAAPIFVDIEADTLNIDPGLIEAQISPRTRAIIPVHIAGRPADLDAVLEIAKRHNLHVIEDAAQAHGAAWKGRKVGSLGDYGTFSLQATKNLNAGEGGLILSNDKGLADDAWSVMNVGRSRDGGWYEHTVLGGNFRITEFQAAIARVQLTRLAGQTAKRAEGARYLYESLQGIEGVGLMRQDPRITLHANHLFPVRIDLKRLGRHGYEEFVAALEAEGIPCSTGYVPLYREAVFAKVTERQGSWRYFRGGQAYPSLRLPACEAVCADTVWLPQHLLLAEPAELDDIAEAIQRIFINWGA